MADKIMTVFGCERDERALFARHAARMGAAIRCVERPLDPASARGLPPQSAVSVDHKACVDARMIHALEARGVKYLCSRSVGLDHIDADAASAAGIAVESVAYSPHSVAEYALMLMLMALRDMGSVLRRAGELDFRLERRRARELRDVTVGVVGTGRIGKLVIERLSAFGCPILACDPNPDPAPGIAYVGLDELLRRCDLVTLHLPLTAANRHLLDAARIARMRPGAILVNTARGALVDSDALADALESGALGGAALDVVEGEQGWFYRDCAASPPPPPFARLLALPNAIITPHTAFYTEHTLLDIVRNTIGNFLEHQNGLRGGRDRWIS